MSSLVFSQTGTFVSKSAGFGILEEQHGTGAYTGRWRNFTFSDDITFVTKDPARIPTVNWDSDRHSRFWLIARDITSDECWRCSYELDESEWLRGPEGGNVWEIRRDDSWIELEHVWEWVPNVEHEGVHREYTHWEYRIDRSDMCIWRATVPEGRDIILYYGTDMISIRGSEQRDNLIISGSGQDNWNMSWDTWAEYFDNGGFDQGVWAVSPVQNIGDPQPPQEPVEVLFVKYLKKDNSNGIDWIPVPDDVNESYIGLVFTCTDPAQQEEGTIGYEVFDITTWQGKSMNNPLVADEPRPTGNTDQFFDFKVDNPFYPLEGDLKYSIRIFDRDEVIDGQTYSERRYSIVRNQPVTGDTLWLIAQDYAAHAIVMPHLSRCSPLRLRGEVNRYYNYPMWGITVPRDYDGVEEIGFNRGDYMADYWEEQNAFADPLVRYDNKILNFYSFCIKDSNNDFDNTLPADQDTFLIGRGYYGDRLTNWEEYRGFVCIGDPTQPHYLNPTHKRTSPRNKTLFIDWRENTQDADSRNQVNRFSNKLDPTEMYYVDLNLQEADRFTFHRFINRNRVGAFFKYFSYPGITNKPLINSKLQNAVSFWVVNNAEIDYWRRYRQQHPNEPNPPADYFAWIVTDNLTYSNLLLPEGNSRMCINVDLIRRHKNNVYYFQQQHRAEWSGDFADMLLFEIFHEMGHSVSMEHIFDMHYMEDPAPIITDQLNPDYGKFFPPNYVDDYSAGNKAEFTITPQP